MIDANQAAPADTTLLMRFHQHEEAAVKELYLQYYRSLCYFAEKLVSDKTEAEDIAVETFLKLLYKRQDFDNLPQIKSFLFTSARNACFDTLRKLKVRERSNRLLVAYIEAPDDFGEKEMLDAKVLQCIYTGLDTLPSKCKKVFTSLFIEHKNTATIAEEMGISPQTVLNQKTRALQLLRLRLQKKGLFKTGLYLLYFLKAMAM